MAVTVTMLGLWLGAIGGAPWGRSADPLGLIREISFAQRRLRAGLDSLDTELVGRLHHRPFTAFE